MAVFDDVRVDLDKEPLISGAETMIDKSVEMEEQGLESSSSLLLAQTLPELGEEFFAQLQQT